APRTRETSPGSTGRAPVAWLALPVFSDGLLQDVLVEREVGDEALEPRVLLFELPQPAQLTHAQVRELPLPDAERRLADAQLPADIAHRCPALRLADGVGDLLFRILRPLHRRASEGWEGVDSKLLLYFSPAYLFREDVRRPSP